MPAKQPGQRRQDQQQGQQAVFELLPVMKAALQEFCEGLDTNNTLLQPVKEAKEELEQLSPTLLGSRFLTDMQRYLTARQGMNAKRAVAHIKAYLLYSAVYLAFERLPKGKGSMKRATAIFGAQSFKNFVEKYEAEALPHTEGGKHHDGTDVIRWL